VIRAMRLGLILAAVTTGMLLAAPAHANPDTDCDDYPTRAAAQAAFEKSREYVGHNWHGLDNDGDGKVCEHSQYPGEPTPPPNPGPSGCAVCTASPSPSPKAPVVERPGPGEGAEPDEPILPVTGPGNTALGVIGGGLLITGIIGIALSYRRRST
jgi:hypothetical protein